MKSPNTFGHCLNKGVLNKELYNYYICSALELASPDLIILVQNSTVLRDTTYTL